MDTTTINYCIAKLDSIISLTAPHVKVFSERYILYKQCESAFSTITCFLITVFIGYIFLGCYKKYKENIDYVCNGWAYPMCLFAILFAVMIIVLTVSIYCNVLILLNPEMYLTDNYIINNVK